MDEFGAQRGRGVFWICLWGKQLVVKPLNSCLTCNKSTMVLTSMMKGGLGRRWGTYAGLGRSLRNLIYLQKILNGITQNYLPRPNVPYCRCNLPCVGVEFSWWFSRRVPVGRLPFPARLLFHHPGVAVAVLRDIFEVSIHDIVKVKTLGSHFLVRGWEGWSFWRVQCSMCSKPRSKLTPRDLKTKINQSRLEDLLQPFNRKRKGFLL